MELKQFYRTTKQSFEYQDLYIQPDQSLTIGEMLDRYIDGSSVSNHESEALEDTNVDNPMRYDSELTDVPTKYQDKDYFDGLEAMARRVSHVESDSNPRVLGPGDSSPIADPSSSNSNSD